MIPRFLRHAAHYKFVNEAKPQGNFARSLRTSSVSPCAKALIIGSNEYTPTEFQTEDSNKSS